MLEEELRLELLGNKEIGLESNAKGRCRLNHLLLGLEDMLTDLCTSLALALTSLYR
jgi:hypothetical protein